MEKKRSKKDIERIEKIVTLRLEGKTEEELAQAIGKSNYKSLRVFQSKQKLKFDADTNVYYAKDTKDIELIELLENVYSNYKTTTNNIHMDNNIKIEDITNIKDNNTNVVDNDTPIQENYNSIEQYKKDTSIIQDNNNYNIDTNVVVEQYKELLKDLYSNKDILKNIIEQYKDNTNVVVEVKEPILEITQPTDDTPSKDNRPISIRVNKLVWEEFSKFADNNKQYNKNTLVSEALYRFIQTFK